MKVATYYQPLWPEREAGDRELLALWDTSWRMCGWETIILSETDAHGHPDYSNFNDAIVRHPTVNDRAYERACFIRHLAYAKSGADLFSDYDVMNLRFLPDESDLRFSALIHAFLNSSVFVASPTGYPWLLAQLMRWNKPEILSGHSHISDMTIFRALPISRSGGDVSEYGHPGWENAKALHFASDIMGQDNRAQKIQGLNLFGNTQMRY